MKKELEKLHMNYTWASCAAGRLRVDEDHEADLKTIRDSLRAIERILKRIMAEDKDLKTR